MVCLSVGTEVGKCRGLGTQTGGARCEFTVIVAVKLADFRRSIANTLQLRSDA